MASKINIFNFALAGVSAKAFVNSLEEDSNERKYCSAVFDSALDTFLGDHDWKFASFFTENGLALERDSDDDPPPAVPWVYEYTYPSDCVVAREILRDTTNEAVVPFDVMLNPTSNGKVIVTDKFQAKLRYTQRISNVTLLSPSAAEAVGWKLATLIVIPLTKDLKLKANAENAYAVALSAAAAHDFNEASHRKPPDPESLQFRGISVVSHDSKISP